MSTKAAPMPKRGPMVPPETKGKTIGTERIANHGRKIGALSNDRDRKGLR